MISYLNLTEVSINGFDKINNLPTPLSAGFTAIYTNGAVKDHFECQSTLLIMLNTKYTVSSPNIGESWKMTVTEAMLDQLTEIVKVFYEHTYLPFEESKILYSEAEQFRAFFDTVPAVMYVKDTESRFIRVNDRFKEHVGLSLDFDIAGKTDFDIFDDQHANQAFADEQAIIKSGESKAAYEEHEVFPDGSENWTISTKIPIRDISNRIIGVSGVSYDITEIKRSEQKAKKSSQDLQKANKKLRQALNKG